MKGSQVNIAPITCQLFNLTIFTTDSDAEYSDPILRQDQAFQVRVTVEFGGPGAIALMPLCLSIKVTFFAEAYGSNTKVELGNALAETSASILTYTPTLTVSTPTVVGLVPEEIYQVKAVLRVGAPKWPALVTGLIEGGAIQTYEP